MTTHDKEVVTTLRAALANRLGPRRYELWFGTGTRMEVVEGRVDIGVPNRFFLDWIRTNFRRQIEQACCDVFGTPTAVEFRVDNGEACDGAAGATDTARGRVHAHAATASHKAATAVRERAHGAGNSLATSPLAAPAREGETAVIRLSPGASSSVATDNGETIDDAAEASISPAGGADAIAAPLLAVGSPHVVPQPPHRKSGARPSASEMAARRAVENTLGCAAGEERHAPRRRFASLADFVAGEANRLALVSAEKAATRPGQLSPLLFVGPTGVGKTHLMEGIWSAVQRGRPRRAAVYLSAEQFTSHFIEALRGTGLPSFRRKYRGVELLLVDDLQFFVGKRSTQVELLYTIDTLLREGRQLVFSADRPPEQFTEFGPEFTARLRGGMVCPVEIPDFAARLGIVGKMAERMQIDVPGDVREFIAARFTCHARAISGALCRLQATSDARRAPISLAMAEDALADMLRYHERPVTLSEIEKAVCDLFGLQQASLQSAQKGQRVSHPRMLAMWLARKYTRSALGEIGRYFGGRSHSTVISAQKRVEDWMSNGGRLRVAHGEWAAEDAVRQVERRLVAG